MKAILPVFDDPGKEPYYMQLYTYLKAAITSGEISEGEKLPSLRSLSRSTGLSITTVEKAYDQLLVEGYVCSRPQSGYYAEKVASGHPPVSTASVPSGNADFDQDLLFQSSSGGQDPVPRRYDPDCFDFGK